MKSMGFRFQILLIRMTHDQQTIEESRKANKRRQAAAATAIIFDSQFPSWLQGSSSIRCQALVTLKLESAYKYLFFPIRHPASIHGLRLTLQQLLFGHSRFQPRWMILLSGDSSDNNSLSSSLNDVPLANSSKQESKKRKNAWS